MAWGARSGLKQQESLQWHFSKSRRKPVHLEAPKKSAATLDELAEPQLPAPRPPESAPGGVPDAACSCGCGCVDAPARLHRGHATHAAPSSGPPGPQTEPRTALLARQTTQGPRAQTEANRARG